MLKADDILSGDMLAGAKLIRLIEENDPDGFNVLKKIYPAAGNAFVIGITGAPGTGKSTLINGLIEVFRKKGKTVAVIAVDPTSPYTGGAILGDRVRMKQHAADKGVFIRSMGSRGQKGGLSKAAKDAVIVLDAMGFEMIIIESVGVGQAELDIDQLAHSTAVVSIPGTGDGIQAIKAGILEIGDLFIINKCDMPDADQAVQSLEMMLDLRGKSETGWAPAVIKTNALEMKGVNRTADQFLSHFEFLKAGGWLERKRQEQELAYFQSCLKDLIMEKLSVHMKGSEVFKNLVTEVKARQVDPLSAAQKAADQLCRF